MHLGRDFMRLAETSDSPCRVAVVVIVFSLLFTMAPAALQHNRGSPFISPDPQQRTAPEPSPDASAPLCWTGTAPTQNNLVEIPITNP
jgi:hypothetical protein